MGEVLKSGNGRALHVEYIFKRLCDGKVVIVSSGGPRAVNPDEREMVSGYLRRIGEVGDIEP